MPKKKQSQTKFKSGFEQEIVKQLERARCPYDYEPEAFTVQVKTAYWPDFRIKKSPPSDGFLYIETKGELDMDDRRKMQAFKESYPDIDLRIVFQKDNYLHKMSKSSKKKRLDKAEKGAKVRDRMRYTDWAKKHGFPCAVGKIPQEWLDE